MVVMEDDALAQRARALVNHGASIDDTQKHVSQTVEALRAERFPDLGYNYRLTDLQGAVGVAQMGRLEELEESLSFGGVDTSAGWVERGEVWISFERDGTASETWIHLDDESGRSLVLEIRPLADGVVIEDAEV